jgi:hypothetical protein
LRRSGPEYPDKELLDGIAHGIRMPADDQMLIVLNPGLLSLAGNLRTYDADIARMEADGMLLAWRFLLYVPCVLLPQGTVLKAPTGACRRITDAGAPRSQIFSDDGTEVLSINAAVRLPGDDGLPKMKPENKSSVANNINDSSVLAALSEAMRKDGFAPHEYRAYFGCDDFKAFFNQFALHPSEWSRFCLAFLRGGDLYVASERVLWFGCAPSSGIAQRFAHLVCQVVCKRMAAEDAPFVADLRRWAGPHVRAWFAHRDALTAQTGIEQALLFVLSIYTDDSLESVVGCARMLRFQRIWAETCAEFGIICAEAHKRGLGTHVLSLGVILCHVMRGAFLPVAKVLRAAAELSIIHARTPIFFWRCHKVFGLTQHFREHSASRARRRTACTTTSARATRSPTPSSSPARQRRQPAGAGSRSCDPGSTAPSRPPTTPAAPPTWAPRRSPYTRTPPGRASAASATASSSRSTSPPAGPPSRWRFSSSWHSSAACSPSTP